MAAFAGALVGAAAYWAVKQYGENFTDRPTPEKAKTFIAEVEAKYKELGEYAGHVYWIQANFVTSDTNWLAAKAGEELTALGVKYAKEASRYHALDLDDDTKRKIDFLRRGLTLPAPEDPAKNAELAQITTDLDSMYAAGTYCRK
ncbi:MAG TPA: M2 family metallopeptidase, partial [Sphingomonadales bacterium]|nr:M2 family metallopeptidase [Sphingomonadales bacterium]